MPESSNQLATRLCQFTDTWVNHPMVRARISCHETRGPDRSLLRTVSPLLLDQLSQVATPDALQAWDRLSANLYWGMKLIGMALRCSSTFPLTAEEFRFAADLLLEMEMENGLKSLLRKVNSERFVELTESELALARDRGIIITDETWYDPGDQEKINQLFCL
ncbi:MAG TPA: hypothetical protein V6C81_12585 [Planktothrix sp.]